MPVIPTTVTLELGVWADPIHKQLGGPEEFWKIEQKLNTAINLCSVQQMITRAEAHRARTRLLKRIGKKANEYRSSEHGGP